MPIRLLICTAFCAGFVLLAVPGYATGVADPFSTAKLLPPPPSQALGKDGQFQPCPALPVTALTLSDVVNATLCGNPQTRAVWANARAQAAGVGVAEAAWLPTLDGSIAASHSNNRGGALTAPVTSNQRNYGLSLSWLIYDFGGREASLKNARQLLEAANASQDATVQALFLAAVQAYYQSQATQAASDAALEAEKAAQESFHAAEARYKAGAATPADKLQAQTAWSQATLNRIRADGDFKNAQGILANTMGLSAATPLQLAAQAAVPALGQFEAKVAQLIDEAVQRRPDLRAAQAQTLAAQAAVDVARASGRPSVSLGISGSETRGGRLPDARSSALGVTVDLPLFSGFSTTYKVRAAEAQAEATAAQSEQLKLKVALDVWNGYQSLTTATQTVRSSADLLASAEQSQRMALGRYKAGMGNILDVLNAQSALASARQQRVQSLYSWNVARAALAQAMGTLDRGLIDSLDERAKP